jgi:hypothetical protein
MAERFMYVCIGVLALTIAFHLGATLGSASIVDHDAIGIVAMTGTGDLLMADGTAWDTPNPETGWNRREDIEPPLRRRTSGSGMATLS